MAVTIIGTMVAEAHENHAGKKGTAPIVLVDGGGRHLREQAKAEDLTQIKA